VAGHETSTNFLGNGLVILLRNRALQQALREDRAALADFVEEVLRWDPPLQCTYRRSTIDQNLDGVPMG
jgi:cytochrome P450